ncbi:hypothetical protein ACFO0N_09750 [Halobium salinum]|uniref:Flagellar protein FlaJ n=1 Tax=Halobium salinum TaxID=1364940 RepID=A0ABD5PBC4_9EURY|nr:hypothetical protein [Halobium salinum]
MAQEQKSDVANPAKRWVLLTGDRTRLAVGLAALVTVLCWALVKADFVYVGAGSNLSTVLSSGMLSGLLTVITVTLSINQLILSRVFGAPHELTDQLEGNLDFRRTVEEIADVHTSPNDPGSFLALIADTLEREAAEFERHVGDADAEPETDVDIEEYVQGMVEYAEHLGDAEGSEDTFDVLLITLGTQYADKMDTTRRLQSELGGSLPDESMELLDDILELLKGVATVRQFFKTLALQQDLAQLSRRLIYTGVVAVPVAYFFAQVYVGGSPPSLTLPAAWLPVVASVSAGLVSLPVAVLVSYLVRVATVTMYTVSVGSFIPPEERIQSP